jgi:hypothetical protein
LQGVEMHDMDIDEYVGKLENIIKKKIQMYSSLKRKITRFKFFISTLGFNFIKIVYA